MAAEHPRSTAATAPSAQPGQPARPVRPARRRRAAVPSFALYGEAGAPGSDLLHIEDIQSRSRLYRWEIDAHRHVALYQAMVVARGPIEVMLDGERHGGEGPMAVIVPPGVVHAIRSAPETEGWVLSFDPRWIVEGESANVGAAFRELFAAARVTTFEARAGNIGSLEALCRELTEEYRFAQDRSPVTAWLARTVVWRLAQAMAQDAGKGQRTQHGVALFTRFRLLLEAHYLEHWPLERYAAQLHLTVERLNRLCKAHAGHGAFELVQQRLTREACRRLVQLGAPVSAVAFELGFRDPAYFCRFFRRRTGQSPSSYRRDAAESA